MTERIYGKTKKGTPVIEEMIATFVVGAERGYEPGQLATKRRGRGRPPLGDAAKAVGSVRLDPSLRAEAARRAEHDGVTVSEIVRRALKEHLRSA